jgi:hypothetical protein
MLIMFLIIKLKQNDHFFNVFLFVQFEKGIINLNILKEFLN